jgi:hypothetical protein
MYIIQETMDSGSKVNNFIPPEMLLQLVELNIKTAFETSSPLVSEQCQRITEGLRLADCKYYSDGGTITNT